jgi:hypothetical protein
LWDEKICTNAICAKGVRKMIQEYRFPDLAPLAETICRLSAASMRRRIAELPDGTYRNTILLPPLGTMTEPIQVALAVTIAGETIAFDYEGSSPEVAAAYPYTDAERARMDGYRRAAMIAGDQPDTFVRQAIAHDGRQGVAHQPVEDAGGPADDVQVPVGHRIEGAGIQADPLTHRRRFRPRPAARSPPARRSAPRRSQARPRPGRPRPGSNSSRFPPRSIGGA